MYPSEISANQCVQCKPEKKIIIQSNLSEPTEFVFKPQRINWSNLNISHPIDPIEISATQFIESKYQPPNVWLYPV